MDRAADHDRHDDLVLDLTQDEIEQDDCGSQPRPTPGERVDRDDRGRDQRSDQGNDLEDTGHDRKRQRVRQVGHRPQSDVGDRGDERDQEQLTAQPFAEDDVDPGQDVAGSSTMGNR